VRKPHRGARAVGIALAAVVMASVISGCDAPARRPLQDPFFDDDASTTGVSGDFDKDEAAWRKQMAREHQHPAEADALLKDDPPKPPDQYGNVARPDADVTHPRDLSLDPYAGVDEDVNADNDLEKPPPATFWEKVGRASFAAMTVIMTLGMMVAPYLLL
jgi:hypothetical protein